MGFKVETMDAGLDIVLSIVPTESVKYVPQTGQCESWKVRRST